MNKKIKIFVIGFLTLLLSVFVFMPNRADAQKLYVYNSVANDPLNAKIYTLENGLTVYMTVYKDAPRIQSYIAVRAGSKNDPHETQGLAHYFEHMKFKGTNNYGTLNWEKEKPLVAQIDSLFEVYRTIKDKDKRKSFYHIIDSISYLASQYAIPNEYDKLASIIGATATNAFTSSEQTVFVNNIPSNQLENWLTIEADRFKNPVLRLFHTELEVIYEEKNMHLTSDDFKVYTALFKELFKKHTYGTQTTIGSTECIKNPSMKNIRWFFDHYYVPNNMAICLSGDFNPDEAIRLIDKKFENYQKKEVPAFTYEKEDPITEPVVKEVVGPNAENVTIGFRFDGANSKDADMLTLTDMILSNRQAGLIDLNLNQKQKVLKASSYLEIMKDYSVQVLTGNPKKGQTLEQVKDLLLSQIELIKKGEFPDWLLPAIINDLKLDQIKRYEKNENRAMDFVESFILGILWKDKVNEFDVLSKITKQDIVDFAKKNFNNNYVIVYKRTGKDKSIEKIKKPKITPIKINRDDKSLFLKIIENNRVADIEPVFLDLDKDLKKFKIKSDIPVLYKENTENKTFHLYYIFEMGTNNDKKLGLSIDYLKYLGTSKYTPEQIQQEFYKLGCSFSVFDSEDQVYVGLSGLSENMDKSLNLFEGLLSDAQSNKQAFDNLIKDEVKKREDNKKNPQAIFGYLAMYGIYGPQSPLTHILSEKEMNILTPEELVTIIKGLNSYEHHILYYGDYSPEKLMISLDKYHKVPRKLRPVPAETKFTELNTDNNKVFFVDYDMKQAMIFMLSQSEKYNKENAPIIKLYNEYFGAGMNSIVFQEMRESRALAYFAISIYQNMLGKKENHFYDISFIMTQTDKMDEAMTAFYDILNNIPESEESFNLAKNSIIQKLRTERITKSDVLFQYESAKKLGLDYDIRKDVFEKMPSFTYADVKAFQEKYIKNQNKTILILGDEKSIDFKILKKYGKVKKLKLKDIFGY